MALISGPTVSNAISRSDNLLSRLVTDIKDDGELIRELYLRILNRPASDEEVQAVLASWKEITQDHKSMEQLLARREVEFKDFKLKLDEQRMINLTQTKTEFENYRKEIEPQEKIRAANREKLIAEKKALLEAEEKKIPANQALWEKKMASKVEWMPLLPVSAKISGKDKDSKLSILPDRSLLASTTETTAIYTVISNTNLTDITGIRLEAIPDDRLKGKGPGLSDNGNFVISKFTVQAAPWGTTNFTVIPFQNAKANFSQKSFEVENIVDGERRNNGDNGWAISPHVHSTHWFTMEAKKPFGFKEGTVLKIDIDQNFKAKQHLLGRFRLSVTTAKTPIGLSLPEELQTAFNTPVVQRDKTHAEAVTRFFVKYDSRLIKLKEDLATASLPLTTDPGIVSREATIKKLEEPIKDDPKLVALRNDFKFSTEQQKNPRLTGAQDLVWVLINSPEFLFNH